MIKKSLIIIGVFNILLADKIYIHVADMINIKNLAGFNTTRVVLKKTSSLKEKPFFSQINFYKTDVFFKTNQAKLSQTAKNKIKKIADKINSKDIVYIKINGFADERGSQIKNKDLSSKRAKNVEDFLEKYIKKPSYELPNKN